MPKKLSEDVLRVLDRSTTDGNKLHLPEQLDRKLYVETAKIIEAAGGKWVRGAKAHVFPGDAAAAIEPILLTGEVIIAKQEFGEFFTPPPVVKRVLDIVKIQPGELLLEPNVGHGALAIPARAAGAIVHAMDIQLNNIQWMRSNTNGIGLLHGDFLDPDAALEFAELFDVVLMNPPFAGQDDIRHVLRALDLLKPDGRLCSVMSSSVTFRSTKLARDFRQLVSDRRGVIEQLPENSFKASGTSVNAVLVSFGCE